MARRRGLSALAAATAIVLVAAGCGGQTGKKTPQQGSSAFNQQANVNAVGKPTSGGTLRMVGNADVDHLDSAAGYYTVTSTLMRAFTRQLFAYPASTDPEKATTVVADAATELPTKVNGGISADGRTYAIHLRSGVMWNTAPPRPVTAQDFVLGFKRLCNPTQNSVGAPGYYKGVILGMDTYCDAFAKVAPTVDAFKQFITSNEISGVQATDQSTVRFTLVNPAGDFVNILALTFSSAVPVEYLQYLPDSAELRQHTISDGPYQIARYVPSQSYQLDRNPAWKSDADPLRHQYVDHIQVTMGPDENGVQQQIAADTQDLQWDTTVPTANVPSLKASGDARLGIYPNYSTNPFLVFNMQSPNAGGALKNVKVRQAIEYAIDKVAIGQVYGGPSLNTPLNQAVPPGNVGYVQFDPYPSQGNRGDAARCRSLLQEAGFANGLTIKDIYRTSGKHPAVYQSVQADLAKCGITVQGIPSAASDYYGKYLSDPTAAKAGAWDISEPGWVPDWFGNNARANIEPLFDGRQYGPGSTDWSAYNNDKVNSDIDKALAATSVSDANKYIHDADLQIMADAVIVPFQTQSTPLYRSTRVHNAIEVPFTSAYDITQIWLNPTG